MTAACHTRKTCYRLRVVSYSSNPSGDCVGPLVGVPEATVRHFNRIAGHATPQLRATMAIRRATTMTEHVQS